MKSMNPYFTASIGVLMSFSQWQQAQGAQVAFARPIAPRFPATIELRAEKTAILLGEPMFLKFVVHNPTAREWKVLQGGDYRNNLGRPDSFKVEVRDAKGKLVSQPDAGFGLGGLMGAQIIPAHGEFAFSLFLPHWATFSQPGRYRITARRTLELFTGNKISFPTSKELTPIPARASVDLQVLPPDSQQMGALIEKWQKAALSPHHPFDYFEDDAEKLRAVGDVRVVPFLVRSVLKSAQRRRSLNTSDLFALAKFNDERAFATLQKLARSRWSDPAPGALAEGLTWQSADDIRFGAASALAQSPHPRAPEFLLSMRHDPSVLVRQTVVQNMGKLPIKRARAMWRKMLRDSSKEVRSEAKRYLENSRTKPKLQKRPLTIHKSSSKRFRRFATSSDEEKGDGTPKPRSRRSSR